MENEPINGAADNSGEQRTIKVPYPEKPYPTIAFCLPGNSFTDGFMLSWTRLITAMTKLEWPYFVSNYRAADMHNCRNRVVIGESKLEKDMKPFGGREYDYMLWIDSDMAFNFAHLRKLIQDDKPVVGGLYPLNRRGDSTAGYLKGNGNHRLALAGFADKSEPFVVDYVGFGFLLIKKGVFETIGFPWFQHRMVDFDDLGLEVHTSEDVAWCKIAKENGFDTWVDPLVRLPHQKRSTIVFNEGELNGIISS